MGLMTYPLIGGALPFQSLAVIHGNDVTYGAT